MWTTYFEDAAIEGAKETSDSDPSKRRGKTVWSATDKESQTNTTVIVGVNNCGPALQVKVTSINRLPIEISRWSHLTDRLSLKLADYINWNIVMTQNTWVNSHINMPSPVWKYYLVFSKDVKFAIYKVFSKEKPCGRASVNCFLTQQTLCVTEEQLSVKNLSMKSCPLLNHLQ